MNVRDIVANGRAMRCHRMHSKDRPLWHPMGTMMGESSHSPARYREAPEIRAWIAALTRSMRPASSTSRGFSNAR